MTYFLKQLILASACIFLFTAGSVDAQVKAFPTAEGFGANTKGGRGGRVIEVTNLNDSGTGSLRACVESTGPRTCVFRITGTITLLSDLGIRGEAGSYITIAGQTSPGGIQLKGFGIIVMDSAHDVIARYLRIRPGAHLPTLMDTNGFTAWGNSGNHTYNVIADHLSIQWSTDQNGPDAWGWVTDMTTQWSIIAEGTTVGNIKGPHGAGTITGGGGVAPSGSAITQTIHHSYYAHNGMRNPLVARAKIADFRNNVVYNWGSNGGVQIGTKSETGTDDLNHTAKYNHVNNYYIHGPNSNPWNSSGSGWFYWFGNGCDTASGCTREFGGTKVYMSNNRGPACPNPAVPCSDDWNQGIFDSDYRTPDSVRATQEKYRAYTPFAAPSVTTDDTAVIQDIVFNNVGARLPQRDTVDARIINEARTLTGNINNIGAGGPWPTLSGPAAPTDTDHDGMPDAWETSHGLNLNNVADGATVSSNGYTNVENYLNELAGDPVPGVSVTPTPTPTATPMSTPSASPLPCINPSPISPGFAAPCPVFSISPASGSASQNFIVSLKPDPSKTVWTYKTLYITEGSTWKSVTLPGNIQYSYWLTGNITYTLAPLPLTLSSGVHYLASWDWTWDATNQCYKGPGTTACGGGQYRIQQITLQ